MIILYIVTAIALTASIIASGGKTVAALKLAARRFAKILPSFLVMLVLFSVAIRLLGKDSGWMGVTIASVLGSVTLMPGFIAFPLCGALLREGVPYMVLSAFATTLMMVGVLTYPLERQYFGRSITIIRNAISLLIALVVTVVMGLVFGEIRL